MFEKYCVSLELARKLKEAGIEFRDCYFYWSQLIAGMELINLDRLNMLKRIRPECIISFIPAPTVNDLWEIVPNETMLEKDKFGFTATHYIEKRVNVVLDYGDTPQDALGQLVLTLKKEGII